MQVTASLPQVLFISSQFGDLAYRLRDVADRAHCDGESVPSSLHTQCPSGCIYVISLSTSTTHSIYYLDIPLLGSHDLVGPAGSPSFITVSRRDIPGNRGGESDAFTFYVVVSLYTPHASVLHFLALYPSNGDHLLSGLASQISLLPTSQYSIFDVDVV